MHIDKLNYWNKIYEIKMSFLMNNGLMQARNFVACIRPRLGVAINSTFVMLSRNVLKYTHRIHLEMWYPLSHNYCPMKKKYNIESKKLLSFGDHQFELQNLTQNYFQPNP